MAAASIIAKGHRLVGRLGKAFSNNIPLANTHYRQWQRDDQRDQVIWG